MPAFARISPCLWFDSQAEEAANYYTSIFPNSRITEVARYPAVGQEIHHQPAGAVMTVAFELDGTPFTALNGGPVFKFTEAVSFQIMCADQQEVDHYSTRLGEGGDPNAQQCGWVKDKFGLSWQVVPRVLLELTTSKDPGVAEKAFGAMLKMKKIDIAELERAVKA
ncbi:VOC family protein [Massilia cavernae]|uniref:VOC family protein n=1 Tax=Massilia cavernae TaxID=2320864 RepID=A0A418X6X0_9BURK|nr:VOC family protein [Massilia cavernae]RJG08239.1 VOC family protein [Massilia cavernae]